MGSEVQVSLSVKPYFLNVDLEIESTSTLDGLAKAMGRRVYVLYCGPGHRPESNLLTMEISRTVKGPDATIHVFCDVVEGLPPAARRIWRAARKVFDVGYELRPSERLSQFSLRPDTLKRIAKLGATLTVTYYRGDTEDGRPPPKARQDS